MGWSDFYHDQVTSADLDESFPVRVIAVHRGELIVSNGEREITVTVTMSMVKDDEDAEVTVGDWILLAKNNGDFTRLLERHTLIKRQAAGEALSQQMVAANVDTLFVITSCNDDFNLSRLERYLAFAYAASVNAVIVLTKIDQVDNADDYMAEARTLGSDIAIEMINTKDEATLAGLKAWCKPGQTVALLGSSGVGKSTLTNMLGDANQKTGDIRDDDSKGRHTTTHRHLLPLASGAMVLDSPGIRSLGVIGSEASIAEVFKDVVALEAQCRFSDCVHEREPGCAVKTALADGSLSARRFSNYMKLIEEQEHYDDLLAKSRKKEKLAQKAAKKGGKKGGGGAKRSKRKK